jgi:hypothetical protein
VKAIGIVDEGCSEIRLTIRSFADARAQAHAGKINNEYGQATAVTVDWGE